MPVNRVANWQKFSRHMEKYISEKTIEKYDMGVFKEGAFDLMSITKPVVCIWNILRYGLRTWNGKMKDNDLEKIAHYTEMAWTISGGKIVKNEVGDIQ